jgi:hypothetical protein
MPTFCRVNVNQNEPGLRHSIRSARMSGGVLPSIGRDLL